MLVGQPFNCESWEIEIRAAFQQNITCRSLHGCVSVLTGLFNGINMLRNAICLFENYKNPACAVGTEVPNASSCL